MTIANRYGLERWLALTATTLLTLAIWVLPAGAAGAATTCGPTPIGFEALAAQYVIP
jgi:hypothetical protein